MKFESLVMASPYSVPGLLTQIPKNNIIVNIVCGTLQIPIHLPFAKNRKRESVEARQIVMVMDMLLNDSSNENAAGLFGLDHATASHAKKKVMGFYQINHKYRATINDIMDKLTDDEYLKSEARFILMDTE